MAAIVFPSPGLFATVLHAFRGADPREMTVDLALGDLIGSLSAEEAEQLPRAIGGVLPLLRSDLDRLRLATEVLVRFDMFEAAGALVDLSVEIGDRELLLSAAALCGNPGVNAGLRQRMSEVMQRDHAAQVRIYGNTAPLNSEESLILDQRWPGVRTAGRGAFRLAPVVVLDTAMPADKVLRLTLKLVRAGATVRRLAGDEEVPNWFGTQTVAICRAHSRTRILSGYPGFPERRIIVDPALGDERDYLRLLRQVDAVLPGERPLRLMASGGELPTEMWDPEVYSLGVYETRVAAFLTSAPVSSLYSLAKQDLLQPRQAGVTVWAFSDLVAVRTWRFLRSQTTKRIKSDVVPALARFAGDAHAVRVGATSDGHVLVDRGDGWVDIRTGEQPLPVPIAELDEVFRPFDLGGRRAPGLLNVSENTRLHPAVLHGSPHLKDRRISAQALAGLDERGGDHAIIAAYPELEGIEISDTVSVGHQLVNAG